MNIVWFKRDLRIEDHEALFQASLRGPVLSLYIFEPQLWQQPDMSLRHYNFLCDCLRELDRALQSLGQQLTIKVGNAVDVFQKIHSQQKIKAIWSHQETWNGWTYARDLEVKHWVWTANVAWHEPTQTGVIRGLRNRDGWAAKWYAKMKKPICDVPRHIESVPKLPSVFFSTVATHIPSPEQLGLNEDYPMTQQRGGRSEALRLLNSFLYERGEGYTKEMSSPLSAFDACSRLSAHLAFGTISIREVFQRCEQRHGEINQMPPGDRGKWLSALRSFAGRLRWHCHFIQKLEDEPRIEFENMHPAYNEIRYGDFNEDFFEAWQLGKTGYPMVDACMRALASTGWLNFRMRAMLMSFASYHLWLDWRRPALHLAKLFVDYEPGIHYSQVQMQSGTTGMNAIRIYNPIKQGIDHDPEGIFIRQWVPELRHLDQKFIHTPWFLPQQMAEYPLPIVDEKTARKAAAEQLYGLRKNNVAHQTIAQDLVKKHGSRKSKNTAQVKQESPPPVLPVQQELPF